MDVDAWLLGAATVLVTQALTLGADLLRRRWAQDADRIKRLEERSDEAAHRLLDLMDDVRLAYEHDQDKSPQRRAQAQQIYKLCHRIDKEAALLKHPVTRDTMGAVSTVLWHADVSVFFANARSASYISANEGREALGSLLRGEPLKSVQPFVSKWAKEIKDAYDYDPSSEVEEDETSSQGSQVT